MSIYVSMGVTAPGMVEESDLKNAKSGVIRNGGDGGPGDGRAGDGGAGDGGAGRQVLAEDGDSGESGT